MKEKREAKEKEIVRYTNRELDALGYDSFARFARHNNISFAAVKRLSVYDKIPVVISSEGKPYVCPGTVLRLSQIERETLDRNAKMYELSVREKLIRIRLRKKDIEAAYEKYSERRFRNEDVELYYNVLTKEQIVANEEAITDKVHVKCVTSGIVAIGNPVNTFTISNEERWICIEYLYGLYRVAYEYELEEKKKNFETLEEAKKWITDNDKNIRNVSIRHRGYCLYKYSNGEFELVDEEKKLAQKKLHDGNFKKMMSEISGK